MYPVSEIYNEYLTGHDRHFIVKAIVNGQEFFNDTIVEFLIENTLSPATEFELGTAIPSKLEIKLRMDVDPPPNAKVTPYLALTGEMGASEWLPLGDYYIDSRIKTNDIWTFTCFDKLVFADTPYVSSLTYPAAQQAVWDEICTRLGYSYDSSVMINPAYTIPAGPAGFSMRQVMGYIAAANGASLFAGKDGVIRFTQFAAQGNAFSIGPSDYTRLRDIESLKNYTRVVLVTDSDGSQFEAGTGGETASLYVYMPWGSQAMANNLLAQFNGFTYQPLEIESRGFPQLDQGDLLQLERVDGSIAGTLALNIVQSFKGGLKMTIKAPAKSEQKSEFVVEGTVSGAINQLNKNAVKVGKSYYGMTVTREEGLTIAREDGKSKAVFNSDKLAFQALVDGSMKDKIYFDPVKGDYVFDGKLSADLISALEAEFDVTVSNIVITNTLAADNGTIAELTVDQLETSNKVKKYLAGDTTDVNYIRAVGQMISWITASTTGEETEQAKDRHGNLLYWKDAEKRAVTTEDTEWPVTIYVYSEQVKRSIAFDTVDGKEVPIDIFGSGTGVGDNGKGFIRKTEDAFELEYISQSGKSRKVRLDDFGISLTPYDLQAMNFYNNGFSVKYSGETVAMTWVKDQQGRIKQLTDTVTGRVIPVSWHSTDM